MEIAKIVQQRYPINLYLTDLRQTRDLVITFADNVHPDFRERLLSILRDMSIDLSVMSHYGNQVEIEISVLSTQRRSMKLCCHGDVNVNLHIEGGEPFHAVAWSIYAIASGKTWFSNSGSYSVMVQNFSLEQQLLARSLLDAVNRHRFGRLTPKTRSTVAKTFSDYIRQMAEELTSEAPSLSLIPVSGQYLDGIRWKWFRNITYRDVLLELNCNINEFEDMESFVKMVRTRPEYNEKINKFVARMMDNLRYAPMADIGNAIMEAKVNLENTVSEDLIDCQKKLHDMLLGKCSPGLLKANSFLHTFAPFDECTRALAAAKMRVYLLADYADALIEKYTQLQRTARFEMQSIQATNLCYLRGDIVPPQRLDWQSLDNCNPDMFSVEPCNWEDNGGSMLANIVMGGFNIPLGYSHYWLCGDNAFPALSAISPLEAFRISGLNRQMLVAFMVKELD